MSRILLVEDESSIRQMLKLNLEAEGYEVVAKDNGKDAYKAFRTEHFDLLLLDIMMPEIDGIQLLEMVRLENDKVPVMFLTAKDSSADKVLGLKRGADDYLTKPFNIEELTLRVSKLIKRGKPASVLASDSFEFGSNKVNFQTFEAVGNQGEFLLTKKEAMLLKLLIERDNEVVSRQQILQAVWGYDVYPSTRTIDNFILSFRKYFEAEPRDPKYFISIRGVGYKFVSEGANGLASEAA